MDVQNFGDGFILVVISYVKEAQSICVSKGRDLMSQMSSAQVFTPIYTFLGTATALELP